MVMLCKYIQKLSPKIKPIEKKIYTPEKSIMEGEIKISCLKNTPNKLTPILIRREVFFFENVVF